MAKDRRMSVRMIAEETGLDKNAKRLRKRTQRVRTDIADDWVLRHDNAPAHTALSIRESGEEKQSRTSTSSLQPRSSSVRFLPLP